MEHFWDGFEKRAFSLGKAVGRFSKGGITPPPIPGAKLHVGSAAAIPGQGAMVHGVNGGLKAAPQSIKGTGAKL